MVADSPRRPDRAHHRIRSRPVPGKSRCAAPYSPQRRGPGFRGIKSYARPANGGILLRPALSRTANHATARADFTGQGNRTAISVRHCGPGYPGITNARSAASALPFVGGDNLE